MSGAGFSLSDLLGNLSQGILSQDNLANGLAQGFQNVNNQNTYNKLLSNPQALGLSPQQAQTMGQMPGYMGLPMLMKLQEANLPTPENRLVNAQVLGANADLSAKRADMDFLLQRQGMNPTTDDEWGKYLGGQGFSRDSQQAQPQQASIVPSVAQSAPTLSAPKPQDAINEQVAANFIQSKIPGATITSQQRTPLHNAQVGGVPDSMHLNGQAVDFVLPKGTTFADAQQAIQQAGLPATELLNEGNHVHWGWGAKPGAAQPAQQPQAQAQPPAQSQSGALPLGDPNLAMQFAMKPTMLLSPQQVAAKGYRPGTVVAEDIFGNDTVKQEPVNQSRLMSPSELQTYNALPGSTINTATGEVNRASPNNSPPNYSPEELRGMAQAVMRQGPSALMGRDQETARMVNQSLYGPVSQGGLRPDNVSPSDWGNWVVNARMGTKARQQAGDYLAKQQTATQVAESAVVNSMNILKPLLAKLPAGGITDWNSFQLAVKQHFNDADAVKINNAIETLGNEYSRVISGTTNGAGSSDAARNEAHSYLLHGYSSGTMDAAMQQMVQEMDGKTQTQLAGLQTLLGDAPAGVGYSGIAPTTKYGNAPLGSQPQAQKPDPLGIRH